MPDYDLEEHVKFKLGKWEIHQLAEDIEYVEAFHHCNPYTPEEDRVEYAYQIPGDEHCPGCDAVQPDEIQGMVAMHNMDMPSRGGGSTFPKQRLMKEWNKIWTEQFRKARGRNV